MKSFMGGEVGAYLGDVAEKSDESQFAYERLAKDTILHGAPDTVLRKIEAFRDVGMTSLMVHYPPYYGPERTLDMLRLAADVTFRDEEREVGVLMTGRFETPVQSSFDAFPDFIAVGLDNHAAAHWAGRRQIRTVDDLVIPA
jgi:hypothetical protein